MQDIERAHRVNKQFDWVTGYMLECQPVTMSVQSRVTWAENTIDAFNDIDSQIFKGLINGSA